MSALSRIKRFTLLMLAIALYLPFGVLAVQAQDQASTPETAPGSVESVRFSLHPANDPSLGYIDDIVIEPGTSASVDVLVQNSGESAVDLRIYPTNAHNGVNGGFSSGISDEEPASHSLWIDFPVQEFTVPPMQYQAISLTINVPVDAAPGQYISSLVAETVDAMPVPGSENFDHRIRYAISIGVLVPGELHYSFELGEPEVSHGALRVPITNTGNYLIRPEGKIALSNNAGEEVVNTELVLQSVYAGNSTSVMLPLPEQLPSGDYVLDLMLTDPESGASAELLSSAVLVPEAEDPRGLSLTAQEIVPSADPIVFLDVSATITNGGAPIPAANVIMEVARDGEVVEQFDLANNQVLLTGENVISSRYIPADGSWEPGTYTFVVIVKSVNPQSGQEVELLKVPVEGVISIP